MNRIEPPPPQHERLARPALAAPQPRAERRFHGIAVSAGVAIGPVFGTTEPEAVVTRQKIQASDIGAEGSRLEAAIVQSRRQLAKLRARLAVLPEESQSEIAPLIEAYIRMLGPSRLVRGVKQRIEETLMSAEAALKASRSRRDGGISGDRRFHHGAGGTELDGRRPRGPTAPGRRNRRNRP